MGLDLWDPKGHVAPRWEDEGDKAAVSIFAAFQNPAALLLPAESGHVIDTSSQVVFGDVATRQVADSAYNRLCQITCQKYERGRSDCVRGPPH